MYNFFHLVVYNVILLCWFYYVQGEGFLLSCSSWSFSLLKRLFLIRMEGLKTEGVICRKDSSPIRQMYDIRLCKKTKKIWLDTLQATVVNSCHSPATSTLPQLRGKGATLFWSSQLTARRHLSTYTTASTVNFSYFRARWRPLPHPGLLTTTISQVAISLWISLEEDSSNVTQQRG